MKGVSNKGTLNVGETEIGDRLCREERFGDGILERHFLSPINEVAMLFLYDR